jgi:hypothetical protein
MITPSPVQTNFQRYINAGQVGMPASSTGWDADTRVCETAAGLAFGLAVSQGSGDKGCIIGGTAFVGITMADPTLAQAAGITTVDTYAQYDNVAVFVRGDIWVTAEDAVTAGEAVYYSTTYGTLGHSGGTVIEDARWMTSAAAGKLAVLRLGNIAGNR